MLRVLEMKPTSHIKRGLYAVELFKENPKFRFRIEAPIYWWTDIDWPKYYFGMPIDDFKFCLDSFTEEEQKHIEEQYDLFGVTFRQIMQILPLSTLVTAVIELTYQQIVEVCENYKMGEYEYQMCNSFPNTREWTDFCETLLDIKGIRDIVKEEQQYV